MQFWRLSDLSLLRSVALPPGPRGDEHYFTGEPKLLPDGQSVYVHTFNCGLYLVRGVDRSEPSATFVKGFPGKDCGVPVLTGHYWLQTVPPSPFSQIVDCFPQAPHLFVRISSNVWQDVPGSGGGGPASTPGDAASFLLLASRLVEPSRPAPAVSASSSLLGGGSGDVSSFAVSRSSGAPPPSALQATTAMTAVTMAIAASELERRT